MAFATKFVSVVVMAVVLVFLVLVQQQQQQQASDYGSGHGQIFGEGPSRKIQNRKVMVGVERKEEAALGKKVDGWRNKSAGNEGEKLVDWELRKVPSGPDPLHHNGGSPKKPRTP